MKTVVAECGQVTIPDEIREQMGIRPGTVMDFFIENGRLVAAKDGETNGVEKVFGCLGKTVSTDALIAELRGRQ